MERRGPPQQGQDEFKLGRRPLHVGGHATRDSAVVHLQRVRCGAVQRWQGIAPCMHAGAPAWEAVGADVKERLHKHVEQRQLQVVLHPGRVQGGGGREGGGGGRGGRERRIR